ncbi:MAG: oligosaccharide flippase family protein, partial [Duncaniella sp.]|nr:oligosaccharide flippase family protein [Duncaniella sp.]
YGRMPGAEVGRKEEWGRIWAEGRPMVKLGGYMTVAAVLTEAVNYVFIACLTRLGGEETVGVYQSGYTIITRYVGMIFAAIGVEYYPRLAGAAGYPRRMGFFVAHEIRLIMTILLPVLLAFVPLVPLVVRLLYSNQFTDAIPYIIAAVPGTVLRGYSWCIAFVILARGDGLIYLLTESVSAVVMLAVNVAGYCLGGLTGLGVGFTLWYALYALTVEVVYRRRYGLSLPWRPVMLTMVTFALTTVAAWCMLSIK